MVFDYCNVKRLDYDQLMGDEIDTVNECYFETIEDKLLKNM